jgi:adenine-specific DNA-methyltransferase
VVIGRFIADFVAPAARIVVEIDGGYHAQRRSADARRDRKLQRMGYRVIRLQDADVRHQLPVALAVIRQALTESQ